MMLLMMNMILMTMSYLLEMSPTMTMTMTMTMMMMRMVEEKTCMYLAMVVKERILIALPLPQSYVLKANLLRSVCW
jgi:hypothetical protein